jgi:hypothetical protein
VKRLIARSLTLGFLVLAGSAAAPSPAPIRAQTLVIIDPNPCCPTGTVDTAYFQNLFVSGATAPVTWTIPSGQLPPGVTLCPNAPAGLYGMPTTAGTFDFTLRVTDSQGAQASEQSRITIQLATPTTPATLSSLAVSPACVTAGNSTTGTVSLTGPAPQGGATVFLPNNEQNVATWPASVTIPAGSMAASFTVSTKLVSSNTNLQLEAGYGNQTQFAELSIIGVPPPPPPGSSALTGSMTTARLLDTATVLQSGKVLVVGGGVASAELYDPASGRWSLTGSMRTSRERQTATLLPNGQVLVAGGDISGTHALSSAELYNPATGSWSATGSMNTARADHNATLLPNGKVLVTFGSFLGLFAELYDPTSGQWSSAVAAACGPSCFFGGSATLLQNGKVLVAGGFGGKYPNRSTTTGVSFFDPATNSWSTAGSMQVRRTQQTASLLANGQVLIAGGRNETAGGSTILTSAELYSP